MPRSGRVCGSVDGYSVSLTRRHKAVDVTARQIIETNLVVGDVDFFHHGEDCDLDDNDVQGEGLDFPTSIQQRKISSKSKVTSRGVTQIRQLKKFHRLSLTHSFMSANPAKLEIRRPDSGQKVLHRMELRSKVVCSLKPRPSFIFFEYVRSTTIS